MKKALLILIFAVSGMSLYAAEGEPGGDILRDFVFIDYIKGDTIGGSDFVFYITPESKIFGLRGDAIKSPDHIPVPCLAYVEFDGGSKIRFMRIVKIYKPVIRRAGATLSAQELAGADYEVVDSINFKDIKELKKLREVTVPIIKNTMPDTILKIKPLPR